MCIVIVLFALVSRLCQSAVVLGLKGATKYRLRLWCIAITSLGFVIYLHGICTIYIMMLIYANWRLSRAQLGGTQTWKRCVYWGNCLLQFVADVGDCVYLVALRRESD